MIKVKKVVDFIWIWSIVKTKWMTNDDRMTNWIFIISHTILSLKEFLSVQILQSLSSIIRDSWTLAFHLWPQPAFGRSLFLHSNFNWGDSTKNFALSNFFWKFANEFASFMSCLVVCRSTEKNPRQSKLIVVKIDFMEVSQLLCNRMNSIDFKMLYKHALWIMNGIDTLQNNKVIWLALPLKLGKFSWRFVEFFT